MGQIHEFYLQPGAADPVLPKAEVLRCVRRFVPEAQAVTGVDETGGEARTYVVDERLVLKVQRPQQLRLSTSLAKEVFYLNQLEAHDASLPVPRVLGYARETQLLEYNLQTRMPGIAFATAALTRGQRSAAVFEVGKLLRRLHAIPQEPFRRSAHFPTDHTAADFRTRLADYFALIDRRLQTAGRLWPLPDLPLAQLAERTLDALPEAIECVAVHANPGPPHTFVDPERGKFIGLIDFGDAYISHPVMDLWRWETPADRRQVFAGYTADGPVSDQFQQVWRCIGILRDVVMIGLSPNGAAEAVEDLQAIIGTL